MNVEDATQDLDQIRSIFLPHTESIWVFPIINSSRNVDINLKASIYDLNYKCLNAEKVKLPSLGGRTKRFLALVNPEGEIINYFFPSKMLPNKTKQYLNYVKTRYKL